MIPFVAGGGILMAISFMFGMKIGDDSVNQFAKVLYEIGHNNAMLLMIPILQDLSPIRLLVRMRWHQE